MFSGSDARYRQIISKDANRELPRFIFIKNLLKRENKMSNYGLKESTVTDVLTTLSTDYEDFFDFIVGGKIDNDDGDTTDMAIFNSIVEVIEAKPFDQYSRVRIAGDTNKLMNFRYKSYILAKVQMSRVKKAVEVL